MINKFLSGSLIALFITIAAGYGQQYSVTSGNYRIYPSNVTQTEVFIQVHPSNPDILFASANSITFSPFFFISEGIYVTTDFGSSWYGSDTCNGPQIQFHGGDPGITIDKDGRFILMRLGRTPFLGLFSHYSTDNGLTWSAQQSVESNDLERATLDTDTDPSSPYFGRTYAVWVRWYGSPFPVVFTYTDDGAENWSAPAQINNPTQRSAGGEVFVGPGGVVYVCWAGMKNSSPYTEEFTGFAKSTNGGADWIVTEQAFLMNGIQGIMPEKFNIRVNGLPRIAVDTTGGSRDGYIYIVTTQRDRIPAGSDPDIIVNKSTDGGATWSAGVRVNQDAMNNGKIQYFPAIHVDELGGVNVLYYDDRSTTSDSAGVWLSRSDDGGVTWTDYPVSEHHFKPQPIGGLGQGYQGDNIDLSSANETLIPVWMDNSSGIYQLWSDKIPLNSLSVENRLEESVPDGYAIEQNYPNPFNPNTVIRFSLPERTFTELKVYDIHGKEVVVLISDFLEAGEHRAEFRSDLLAAPVSSGVYFYRLTAGDYAGTKKMILMK